MEEDFLPKYANASVTVHVVTSQEMIYIATVVRNRTLKKTL